MKTMILTLLSVVLLVGCAGESQQKKAEQAAATGNGLADEIDKLLVELMAEGIVFNANARDEDPAIKEMKEPALKTTTQKLDRMVSAIGEYVAILNRDDMKLQGGLDKNDVRAAYTSIGVRAGKHLKYANKRLTKIQATKNKAG